MGHAGLNLIRVESPDDPRLALYRNQKDAWLARQRGQATPDQTHGVFIAEGVLVFHALADSSYDVRSVLIGDWRLDAAEPALVRCQPGTPVYVADRAMLESVVGFDLHRGVLAIGTRPPIRGAGELLARAPAAVVLEDVSNHDNVGSIFRCVAGLAPPGTPVILTRGSCDPLYRKSLRVSMGSVLKVPWGWVDSVVDAADLAESAGLGPIALTPDVAAFSIDAEPLPVRPALFLGAEGPGLSGAALARISERRRIPMNKAIDSLNVSVAAGIALHRLCS